MSVKQDEVRGNSPRIEARLGDTWTTYAVESPLEALIAPLSSRGLIVGISLIMRETIALYRESAPIYRKAAENWDGACEGYESMGANIARETDAPRRAAGESRSQPPVCRASSAGTKSE